MHPGALTPAHTGFPSHQNTGAHLQLETFSILLCLKVRSPGSWVRQPHWVCQSCGACRTPDAGPWTFYNSNMGPISDKRETAGFPSSNTIVSPEPSTGKRLVTST